MAVSVLALRSVASDLAAMRCALCPRRAVHRHHVLAKGRLKREGYAGAVLRDPRNLMDLCLECHFGHENWRPRIARHLVPVAAWVFARELGEWAVVALERAYPEANVRSSGHPPGCDADALGARDDR